jgi:hypothetical protein
MCPFSKLPLENRIGRQASAWLEIKPDCVNYSLSVRIVKFMVDTKIFPPDSQTTAGKPKVGGTRVSPGPA